MEEQNTNIENNETEVAEVKQDFDVKTPANRVINKKKNRNW